MSVTKILGSLQGLIDCQPLLELNWSCCAGGAKNVTGQRNSPYRTIGYALTNDNVWNGWNADSGGRYLLSALICSGDNLKNRAALL
jgi:hypothetical protein